MAAWLQSLLRGRVNPSWFEVQVDFCCAVQIGLDCGDAGAQARPI